MVRKREKIKEKDQETDKQEGSALGQHATLRGRRRIFPVESSQAFWGNAFRTLTFTRPDDPTLGTYWLKAVLRPDEGWNIMRVTKYDFNITDAVDHSFHKASRQTRTIKEGLSFMAALEYLASFEEVEKDVTGISFKESEIKTLGYEHYKAFGRREGYVFDANGMPHETNSGEILTDGEFMEEDIEAMLQDFRQAQEVLAQHFGILDNDQTLYLMAPHKGAQGMLKAGFDILRARDENMMALEKNAKDLGAFCHQIDDAIKAWKKVNPEGKALQVSSQCFDVEEKLRRAQKTLDEKLQDFVCRDYLARGLETCFFSLNMFRSKALFARVTKDNVLTEAIEKDISNSLQEAAQSLQSLGIPDFEEIRLEASVFAAAAEGAGQGVPEPVLVFHEACVALDKKASHILSQMNAIAAMRIENLTKSLEEAEEPEALRLRKEEEARIMKAEARRQEILEAESRARKLAEEKKFREDQKKILADTFAALQTDTGAKKAEKNIFGRASLSDEQKADALIALDKSPKAVPYVVSSFYDTLSLCAAYPGSPPQIAQAAQAVDKVIKLWDSFIAKTDYEQRPAALCLLHEFFHDQLREELKRADLAVEQLSMTEFYNSFRADMDKILGVAAFYREVALAMQEKGIGPVVGRTPAPQ